MTISRLQIKTMRLYVQNVCRKSLKYLNSWSWFFL